MPAAVARRIVVAYEKDSDYFGCVALLCEPDALGGNVLYGS